MKHKLNITFVLLTLAFCVKFLPAQIEAPKSIQQIQSEYYSKYKFPLESDFDRISGYKAPPRITAPAPGKHIFGWNPSWVGTAYTSYNYNLLTTVGYFSYEVDTATGGYTNIYYWRTTNLIPLANSYGVKVVLTVTNFGISQNTRILSDPVKRQTLIDSLIALVQFRQADGVNIDFESVGSSQRTNLTTFMTALSQQMHTAIPGSQISIDLPAVDWNNSFNVVALNNVCDYMIMMGYDYYWSTAPNAGPCAPLQSGGVWGAYNVTNSVNYYLTNGATPNKFLLGVPYYGYEWPTTNQNINSTTTGTGTAYQYSSMKTRAASYGRLWDTYSLTPWYNYQSSGWRQGWYDDSVSLGLKYDLVNSDNMGGIGIWALSYDGSNSELWNEIYLKFGLVGISQLGNEIPNQFKLYQNYPNPFNPTTAIKFDLPKDANVSIKVYDMLGNEVVKLVDEFKKAGSYSVDFNGTNLASGVYFYRIEAGDYVMNKKMVLVK